MEVARYQVEQPILKDPRIPEADREKEFAKQLGDALKDLSTHESSFLAIDPIPRFERIYDRLGQVFDERAAATIREHSNPSNPAESADPADHRRDSSKSITTWKDRLSDDEIGRIRSEVESISKEFYSDADW